MNETMPSRRATADIAFAAFILGVSALYIFMAVNIPVTVITTAPHDDAFFVKAAKNIVSLQWFGEYSQMTLMKGESYSFLLAINRLLGLPINLTTSVVVVLADFFFAWTLYRIHGRRWLFCLVFVLILFNPALIPTRVIRDAIYAPETLTLLACAIQLLFLAQRRPARIGWGIATGMSLAAFWYTREEGVWILPALALLILVQLVREWRRWVGVVAAGATAFALLALVATLNYVNYGTFVVVDFTSKPFSSTLSLLQSVRVGEPVSKVPVPAKVRQQIYAQSPAFNELKPYLEDIGKWWTAPGCDAYPKTCGDYAGGWFMWALRDAVAWAGHYKSAAEANAYYRRLADEVKAACGDGRLTCHKSAIPFLPEMPADDLAQLPWKLKQIQSLLLSPGAYVPWASVGTAEALAEDDAFLGHPLRYPINDMRVSSASGWFIDPAGRWIEVRCGTGTAPIAIERQPSPDLVSHFNDPKVGNNRFELQAATLPQGCVLQVQGDTSPADGVRLDALQPGSFRLGHSDSHLQIDAAEGQGGLTKWKPLTDGVRVYRGLFSSIILVLLVAMATTLILALVMDRNRFGRDRDILLVALILAVAASTRLTLILLVDLSSFPAINEQYGSAIFPLFTTILCLPLALLTPRRPTGREGAAGEAI